MPLKRSGPFWRHARHLWRFLVVGIVNTSIDFGAFAVLFYALDCDLIFANSLAYGAAVVNSYLMNKHWTFSETRNRGRLSTQFATFAALNSIGLGLSNLVVWLMISAIPALFAKACATGITFLWNYWSSRRFVYRPSAVPPL